MVKLGKSTNFLFMKRINTGKSHSRHRFHADAVWKQGVSCVSDIHWTHGGVELRKGGTIREKVRNKGMNDRRINFGKVGYYVYYRKRSFFSYSMYIYIYIVWKGKKGKKAIQAYMYRKRTETCRQYIFGSHMICFSLPSCQILVLADFPPFDEWSYNCDMPDIIDKWTNQRVVRWPFRLRLWQK